MAPYACKAIWRMRQMRNLCDSLGNDANFEGEQDPLQERPFKGLQRAFQRPYKDFQGVLKP